MPLRRKTMASPNPQSTAQIAGHPLHPMLIPFPVAFLVATFACDLIFWRTGNPAWSTAALWLLGAALVMAALAAGAGGAGFFGGRRRPGPGGGGGPPIGQRSRGVLCPWD